MFSYVKVKIDWKQKDKVIFDISDIDTVESFTKEGLEALTESLIDFICCIGTSSNQNLYSIIDQYARYSTVTTRLTIGPERYIFQHSKELKLKKYYPTPQNPFT